MSLSIGYTTKLSTSSFILFSVSTTILLTNTKHLPQVHNYEIQPTAQIYRFFVYRLPNGEADPKSKHGGCPVLSGVKVRFPR
jgi:hypothetical protein